MEDIIELIKKNYNINVNKVEKIKNAYKIQTDKENLCFKVSKYDWNQFSFIISCIQHLIDKGFTSVISFIKTKDGEKYIKTEEGYAFLCQWVNSREANFENPVELKMCVETLSDMHVLSRDLNTLNIPSVRNSIGKWPKKFKKRCDELLLFKTEISGKNYLTEFDEIYLKYFDEHYKQALKSIKDIEKTKYASVMENHQALNGFCHHDTANHNFLITPELKVYMVDFDYCIVDSYLHDLSSIAIRNMKYGNWNFDTLRYIVNIYSNRIPISNDDLYIMFCFMEFPQDFWQIGLQYYVEKQPWKEEVFLKKLKRTVEDSRDRNNFLKSFEARIMEGEKCQRKNLLK